MPFGQAILFVLSLALSIIVGVCVLTFAARCMLVIVQESAQGQDDITWPKEPYMDWLGHAALFIELLGIWIAPAALAARLLRHVWLPDAGALRVLVLAGPGLWLFFPVGLLSSLSAESRWTPLRWAIVSRLLRIAPATLAFYFLTALVLSAAAVPWYYALFDPTASWLLFVAALAGSAVLFIYARLLGRLAWLVARLPDRERAAAKPKAEDRKPAKPSGKKKRKRTHEAEDPWAIPEEERSRRKTKPKSDSFTPPSAYDIEGYGFATDEPAPPPPAKPPHSPMHMLPEEYDPYTMQSPADVGPSAPVETQSEMFAEQVRQRIAERTRDKLPAPPPHPFFNGVYTFPWYSQCLSSWFTLSLGLLILGFIVRLMLSLAGELLG